MAMILPKGIVVNSPQVSRSIEELESHALSNEDISRFWKVYTTTQRRLKDPTAERLESLWWRIWGSRRRELSGAVVAKLFAGISNGETFVPLRGPPNRDEGVSTSEQRPQPRTSASSTTALSKHRPNGSNTNDSSSSREQAPMPHPILKKTRGPSNSGPKPTARFALPDDAEDGSPESSESQNAHVVVIPPSAPTSPREPQGPQIEKKLPLTPGRKRPSFTASHKKKRPVIVKRHSSASSTDGSIRNSDTSKFSAMQPSSVEHTPPSFAAQARIRSQSRFQENFSPSSASSPKKPETLRGNGVKNVSPRKPDGSTKREKKVSDEIPPFNSISNSGPGSSQADSWVQVPGNRQLSAEDHDVQRILLEEANARVESRNQRAIQLIKQKNAEMAAPPTHVPRKPSGGSIRGVSGGGSHAHDLLSNLSKSHSTVSLAPMLASPSGQLDLGGLGDSTTDSFSSYVLTPPELGSGSGSGRVDKGKGRDLEDLRRTAMFSRRNAQVPEAPATPEAPSALSRSKSQLSMLLEKDRAQTGSKGKEKSPKEKKGRK